MTPWRAMDGWLLAATREAGGGAGRPRPEGEAHLEGRGLGCGLGSGSVIRVRVRVRVRARARARARVGLVVELLHTRGSVEVIGVDSGDAFHLKKVLDEVGECEALQRIGRRCASKERVGEAVGERGARRGRRELWDMVDCEVVGGGHRPVTAGGADDCVCTKPGEGSLHELMCADERVSFGAAAVSDGKPDANGVGGTSEDLLRERARDVTRLHLSALPGSKSVELLISSTAIRKAAIRLPWGSVFCIPF